MISDAPLQIDIRMIRPGNFMIEGFQLFYKATIVRAFTFMLWSVAYPFHFKYDL